MGGMNKRITNRVSDPAAYDYVPLNAEELETLRQRMPDKTLPPDIVYWETRKRLI